MTRPDGIGADGTFSDTCPMSLLVRNHPYLKSESPEDGMDSQPSDINARLEKLERENRRIKKIGIVAIVFVSILFVSGQAKTNKVIEANEFRVVDASGKVLGTLGLSESGATLRLNDTTGKVSAVLGANSIGSTVALLNSNAGASTFFVTSPGGLNMYGPSGNIKATVEESGPGPNVAVADKEGYSSILGRSDLVLVKSGKKEQTPAASLVLFDKDRKVLWSAP